MAVWHNSKYRHKVRRNVLARDGYMCRYCGRELEERTATLDHVIPRSVIQKMGLDIDVWDLDNLVVCCGSCNSKKGARLHVRKPPATYSAPGW